MQSLKQASYNQVINKQGTKIQSRNASIKPNLVFNTSTANEHKQQEIKHISP